jgi:TonB family protein
MKQLLSLTILILFLINFAFGQDNERGKISKTKQLSTVIAVAPIFPAVAKATNTSGKVIVEVNVNKDGNVTSAKTVEGHSLLCRTAEVVARMWKFEVAENESKIQLTFVFSILQKSSTTEQLLSVFTIPYQVEVKTRPIEPLVSSDPVSDKNKQKHKRN